MKEITKSEILSSRVLREIIDWAVEFPDATSDELYEAIGVASGVVGDLCKDGKQPMTEERRNHLIGKLVTALKWGMYPARKTEPKTLKEVIRQLGAVAVFECGDGRFEVRRLVDGVWTGTGFFGNEKAANAEVRRLVAELEAR